MQEMKWRTYGRWLSIIAVCISILSASIAIQIRYAHIGVAHLMQQRPESIEGFFGEEYSQTIPSIDVFRQGNYRWSGKEAHIDVWPASASGRILEMTYIAPFGPVAIGDGQHTYAELTTTPILRTATVLIPAPASPRIYLFTATAQRVDNRTLGVMVTDISWRGSTTRDWPTSSLLAHTLAGLPFTVLLLLSVTWALSHSLTRTCWISAGVLAGVAVVGMWHPNTIIAAQPTWQFVLLSIGGAYAIWHTAQRWESTIRRIPASWWLIAVWVISLLCYFRPIIQSDGAGYYAFARSVFIDGDIDFRNDFAPTLTPFLWPPDYGVSRYTGATINPFTVGPALYWTPMWWISHGITLAGKLAGLPWQADGNDMTYVVCITFATAVAGLGALFTLYQLLEHWYTPSLALLTTMTMYVGTNLMFYTVYEGSYAHALSTWLSSIVVTLACRLEHDQRLRIWLWCAAATAALVLTYWVNAIVALVPMLVIAHIMWRHVQRRDWDMLKRHAIYLGGMLIIAGSVLAPQLAVWQVMQGAWYRIPRESVRFTPQEFQLVAFFVGPLYGMIWWTPVYAIGLIGLGLFARIHRWQGAVFLLTCVAFIVYNTSIPNWHGSSGYGLRRLTSILPILAIGFAHVLHLLAQRMHLAWVLSVACMAWSVRLMLRYSEYKFQRGPEEFLQALRVSLLSPGILPTEPFAHVQSLWWGRVINQPSVEMVVISGVLVIMMGATVYGTLKIMDKVRNHG